jgi:hypothetical protein
VPHCRHPTDPFGAVGTEPRQPPQQTWSASRFPATRPYRGLCQLEPVRRVAWTSMSRTPRRASSSGPWSVRGVTRRSRPRQGTDGRGDRPAPGLTGVVPAGRRRPKWLPPALYPTLARVSCWQRPPAS